MSYTDTMNEVAEAPAVEEETKSDILTVADRCDTCGAQAFVRLTLTTGELDLCGHHFSKGEEKIRKIATGIADERYKINEKASASSPD